ncbi:MAG: hypothetical protein ABII02_00770 [Candidatus Magasanikbacteria bacterium]
MKKFTLLLSFSLFVCGFLFFAHQVDAAEETFCVCEYEKGLYDYLFLGPLGGKNANKRLPNYRINGSFPYVKPDPITVSSCLTIKASQAGYSATCSIQKCKEEAGATYWKIISGKAANPALAPSTYDCKVPVAEKICTCSLEASYRETSSGSFDKGKLIEQCSIDKNSIDIAVGSAIEITTYAKIVDKKKCLKEYPAKGMPVTVFVVSPCSSVSQVRTETLTGGSNKRTVTAKVTCTTAAGKSTTPESPPAKAVDAKAVDAEAVLKARYKRPAGYEGPLPDCAFSGTCKDVDDLLLVAIRIGRMIFGFIGSFALLMFVYGGFVWVTSFGNAEKVKKGQSVVVAAVVGLAIALGAYVIIDFLLDSLGVQSSFRVIK